MQIQQNSKLACSTATHINTAAFHINAPMQKPGWMQRDTVSGPRPCGTACCKTRCSSIFLVYSLNMRVWYVYLFPECWSMLNVNVSLALNMNIDVNINIWLTMKMFSTEKKKSNSKQQKYPYRIVQLVRVGIVLSQNSRGKIQIKLAKLRYWFVETYRFFLNPNFRMLAICVNRFTHEFLIYPSSAL